MKKAWFSAAEIAAEALPGVPGSKRGVARIAERMRWDSTDHARPRDGHGGGLEYHFSLLPEGAQAALAMGGSASFAWRADAGRAQQTAEGFASERETFHLTELLAQVMVVEAGIGGAGQK